MKAIKTIANCCLVFITVIAVCVIIAFVYYHYFVKDTTIGVNNVNDQLAVDIKKDDELTPEEKDAYAERWFMEANYYSNDKNNGVQLQELKYNYFTGYGLTESEYRSTGMQYMGDFETYMNEVNSDKEAQQRVLSEFYYYDTTNGITWSGFKGQYGSVATTLNREQQFIIKIDNRPFSIQLTGQYDVYGRLWGFFVERQARHGLLRLRRRIRLRVLGNQVKRSRIRRLLYHPRPIAILYHSGIRHGNKEIQGGRRNGHYQKLCRIEVPLRRERRKKQHAVNV